MQIPHLPYLWLAANLKLRPHSPSRSTFAGVTSAVEPEHYQLRGMFKQRAIEPVRSTFQALVRNCSPNRALPISSLNLAMGAAETIVEMTALPGSGINHVTSLAAQQADLRQSALQLSLDQFRLQELAQHFSRIVLKIDVERYEFEVLAGAQSLLGSDVPMALCVECAPDERSRLESLFNDRFLLFDPPQQQRLSVLQENHKGDFFFRNDTWPSFDRKAS